MLKPARTMIIYVATDCHGERSRRTPHTNWASERISAYTEEGAWAVKSENIMTSSINCVAYTKKSGNNQKINHF